MERKHLFLKQSLLILCSLFVILTPNLISHASPVIGQTGEKTIDDVPDPDGELPRKYDSYEYGLVTPAKSQGSFGICWAYAITGALETSMIKNKITNLEDTDLSEYHLTWFSRNSLLDPLGGTQGDTMVNLDPYDGGFPEQAINAIATWVTPVQESTGPYEPYNMPQFTSEDYKKRAAILTESGNIPITEVEDIKRAILENGSVATAYYVTYNSAYYNGDTNAQYCNSYKGANHSVMIVGWDDDFSKDNFGSAVPRQNGAWRAKNSYGTAVDNGYFWISYEDYTLTAVQYVNVCAPDKYDNNYQYDGASPGYDVISGRKLRAVNVFTTKANPGKQELLEAVQFDIYYSDTNYSVQVYKQQGEEDIWIPLLSELINGNKKYRGRVTVDLETPILFNQGETFAVAITHTDPIPTDDVAIEVERPVNSSSTVSSLPGQSFCQVNDGEWKDIGADGTGNLRIKAFTKNVDEVVGTDKTYTIAPTSRLFGTSVTVAPISMNPSDGKVPAGEEVTLTAPKLLNYNFKGWYLESDMDEEYQIIDGKTTLSEEFIYTFIPKDDMHPVAVYESTGKKVAVTVTGTNYSVSINDRTPVLVQSDVYTDSVDIGSKVTITTTDADFIHWCNTHNIIVSTEKVYTFIVTQDVTLQMNKKGSSGASAMVIFVSESNQVIESKLYDKNSEITIPKNGPSKVGHTFTGWSLTAEEIKAKIAVGETYITVIPVYEQNTDTTYAMIVYINGIKDDTQSVADILAGTTKIVHAPEVEGKVFLYWTNKQENGTILGYERYYFMQIQKDIEIFAVYGEAAVEVKPVVALTNIYTSSMNGTNKLSFSITRDIPEGYTLVEHGMLYDTKQNITNPSTENVVLAGDGVSKFVSNTTKVSGVVNLNVNVTGSEDKKVIVRGYMIVKDGVGNEEVYYTDIAYTSYGEQITNKEKRYSMYF